MDEAEYISDEEPKSSKRKRVQTRPPTNGRTSRSRSKKSPTQAAAEPSSGKSPRAAKLQANRKLDAQARELEEYRRIAAAENKPGSRTTRQSTSQAEPSRRSPRKPTVMGTRASARLRGSVAEDDEWQPIPDEWLREKLDGEAPSRSQASRRKGKRKAEEVPVEEAKTGLESDAESSALTELTELPEEELAEETTEELVEDVQEAPSRKTKTRSNKRRRVRNATSVVEEAEGEPVAEDSAAEELEPKEPDQPALPEDFIEWETVRSHDFRSDRASDERLIRSVSP